MSYRRVCGAWGGCWRGGRVCGGRRGRSVDGRRDAEGEAELRRRWGGEGEGYAAKVIGSTPVLKS